jgi:hypothetical protein
MGMEEVEMEDKRDTEVQMQMEMVLGDASWPEVTCPDCYEHHDVAPLCIHLEEGHPYEPHAAVSPSPRCFTMPCPARLPCRTLTVLLIVTLFGIVCSLLSVW